MQRYTIKHFWRMKESEDGEFVRYDKHKEETERERDSHRKIYKDLMDAHCAMTKNYHEEQKLSDHLGLRVGILFTVLMAVMGIVVSRLIGWSFGYL